MPIGIASVSTRTRKIPRLNRAIGAACLVAGLLFSRAAGADARVRIRPEWRRAAPWEYVASGILLGGSLTLRATNTQTSVNWRGGILFDDDVLDAIAIEDLDRRSALSLASNIAFGGAMAYRVVDSMVLPLALHGQPDLALQLSITDTEALSLVGALVFGSQVFVARERPIVERRCGDPAVRDQIGTCDADSTGRNRSFIAGHVAIVLAATGLTCVHHSKLPLYGGGVADVIPCVAMFGVTAFTAYSRIAIESHYPSDVVLGLVVGAGAGWLVPLGLRYGFGGRLNQAAHVSVLPFFTGEQTGFMLVGDF
jgi:membrane-associated phospholipid phosphatase